VVEDVPARTGLTPSSPGGDQQLYEEHAAELLARAPCRAEMWARNDDGVLLWHTSGFAELLGAGDASEFGHLSQFVGRVHLADRAQFGGAPAAVTGRPLVWRLLDRDGSPTGRWMRTQVAGRAHTPGGPAWVGFVEEVTAQVAELVAFERLGALTADAGQEVESADEQHFDAAVVAALGAVAGALRHRDRRRRRPSYLFCGKPRSTPRKRGSGQRPITTVLRV
jgi:hypothetical protein